MNDFFINIDWSEILQASIDTFWMLGGSLLFTVILGLPLGVLLFLTGPRQLFQNRAVYALLSFVVNVLRSLPFIILLIVMIPFTVLITGTSLGVAGAIPPLVVGATPFFARLVETALREVDKGIIEATQAMGASTRQIICNALLPEARPGIIAAITFAAPLHMNLLGALLILVFGFLFSTVSSRLTGEVGSSSNPISGMAVATLLFTCLIFLVMGWTGGRYYVTALSVGAIVCIAASNAGTTSQDLKTGFLVGSTPKLQQYAILAGALASALILGPILLKLNDAGTVYVPAAQVAPHIRTDASTLTETAQLQGPQAASDHATYKVWQKTDTAGGPAGKYLVRADGSLAYLVDPGINGQYHTRPDGTEVKKFDAPKAVLMSYIIKGILDHQLPWTLVLFGVMVAVVLEMSGVASLAFTVGVYLPLVSTLPIAIGGIIRWMVDRRNNTLPQYQGMNEEALQAAGDRSSGTLLASGYIAGGALAGIIIAITAGVMTDFDDAMNKWAEAANPFFAGASADLLSILPYAAICVLLYVVGRERARK